MKGLQEPVVVVGIDLGWAVLQGLTFAKASSLARHADA